MISRFRYDNHPPARAAADDVRKKFAAEEANSFHVAYPKFTTVFIPGLMLSPISWIIQKGKGLSTLPLGCLPVTLELRTLTSLPPANRVDTKKTHRSSTGQHYVVTLQQSGICA
jgi:hypothetical protein